MARNRLWPCSDDIVIIGFFLLLVLDLDQLFVSSATRNEPVNINWIIALPWDVANTLRAPLGGPVSLALSCFMALILLFGLLLSPVQYIFGYPPRIYHTYRKPGIITDRSFPTVGGNYHRYGAAGDDERFDMVDILFHLFDEVRASKLVFDQEEKYNFQEGGMSFTGRELVVREDDYQGKGFLESIFMFVPEEDEVCRQLLICHSHGFLGFFPPTAVKFYQWLSKHFMTIPENYKAAIKLGLQDQGACQQVYSTCQKDLFHLTRSSFGLIREKLEKFLPDGTKDLWRYFYKSRYGYGKQSSSDNNEI